MRKTLFFLLLYSVIASAGISRGDIYRLESEDDETISFTDSPKDKRFQLVLKEPQVRQIKTGGNKGKSSLTAREPEEAQPDSGSATSERTLPVQGRITSPTGFRNDPIDGKLKHHNGLDIATPSGTPVKPVAPGTVLFSGWKPGYGNMVILDHHDGMTTIYAHHESNSVSEGTQVSKDTVIAHTGSTGRSTGPHLHFEAWRNGTNITRDFMPDSMAGNQTSRDSSPPINRYLQADGTIIFTNLR